MHLGDKKSFKRLKLFMFLKFFCVCQFPTNIRNSSQKRPIVLQKEGEKGEKQTNSNFFFENKQSEKFCLTYSSKLNRDPIEKKLYRFEDPHCNRGGGASKKLA